MVFNTSEGEIMIAWYWVILIAMGSGSFGALVMAVIAGSHSHNEAQGVLKVVIVEDRRAEKTSVEFAGRCFALPERLGLPLRDLLVRFAIATGHQTLYHLPKEPPNSLRRVHELEIR